MQEKYQIILLHYITEGGEPDLELAYEYGRQAIIEGTSVLQVIDAHYQALAEVLEKTSSVQDCVTIVQRASSLLKEALGPFEMTQRGYGETINTLRSQNEKLTKLMEERSLLLQQREDFMMVVTHDLKTPINAADRCLNLMLEGDFGQLTSDQLEVLATMKDSNQRMSTMVKNLLEAYRYDQSTPMLAMKELDLRSSIQTVIEAFKLSAQMRGLTIGSQLEDNPTVVHADETAILHVLTNLVDNAIKFTPECGTITVSAKTVGTDIEIVVRDTGKGISMEDQPRLFQRFFQADSGRKQYTGTGLGLYLCDQIIRAHKGTIRCQSEPGVGTSFIITMPALSVTEKGVAGNSVHER